jgi:predicted RNA binding protein YcfA (HicA-like mRNA interferase family)
VTDAGLMRRSGDYWRQGRRGEKCKGLLDTLDSGGQDEGGLTARKLLRVLKAYGCAEVRRKGSHVRARCGKCSTTVPSHRGEDIGTGLLAKIERDLAPCLGEGWLGG